MTESHYPTVDQLVAGQRVRRNVILLLLILTVTAVFSSMGILMGFFYISGPIAWLVALGVFLCLAVPVLVWHVPRVGVYLVLAGAMLFESYAGVRAVTMRVPFFWNISTIGQQYGRTGALNAFPFSIAEILLVTTLVAWLARAIVKREFRFVRGAYLGWLLAYVAFVGIGFARGLSAGGDVTMALWEVRSQAHLLVAYLLAANLVTDRRHVLPVLWLIVLCAGFKGILGAYNYFAVYQGSPPIDGVLMHEESLFFNLLFFVLFVAALSAWSRGLVWAALLATPMAVLSALANQRRAGIAAFIVAMVPLVPILWVVLEKRRTQVMRFAVAFGLLTAIYLPVAWNGRGPWALPARAIRSQNDPNARDAGSDYYRLAENIDLKYTRDMSPWIGYGYGKPFIQIVPLPQVTTSQLQYFAHNSILWVWMRIGHVGFLCLMMLFATVLIKGCQTLRRVQDPMLQTVGVLGVLMVLMLFSFGKYDLQLVNSRTMITTGVLIGILGVLGRLDRPAGEAPAVAAAHGGPGGTEAGQPG